MSSLKERKRWINPVNVSRDVEVRIFRMIRTELLTWRDGEQWQSQPGR